MGRGKWATWGQGSAYTAAIPKIGGPALVVHPEATPALLLGEDLGPLLRQRPACSVAPSAAALKEA